MVLPPILVDVSVLRDGERGFRLWLPLVVLWPILLAVLLVALVLTVLADWLLFLGGARYHRYTLLLLELVHLLAEVRGTRARIDSPTVHTNVAIY